MALPYYMPPVAPPAQFMNGYYGSPHTTRKTMEQIYHQQNMYQIPFQHMYGMYYPSPHAYQHSLPPAPYFPPYQQAALIPQYGSPYEGVGPSFHHMPTTSYPDATIPVQTSQDYHPAVESGHSFLSDLKSAADRLAQSDAKAKSESTAALDSKTTSSPGEIPESTSRAMSQRKPVPDNTENIATPESRAESHPSPTLKSFLEEKTGAGNELLLANDPSLGQQYAFPDGYKPGAGQQYISKIRALVEGSKPTTPAKRGRKPRSTAEPPLQTPEKAVKCSAPTESKKRKNSESCDSQGLSKLLRTDWCPRPASANLDYLYIGANGTIVPSSFYAKIPWEECEESIKLMTEYLFDDGTLAAGKVQGEHSLYQAVVEDIVNHICAKCLVRESYVKSEMAKVCAARGVKIPGIN